MGISFPGGQPAAPTILLSLFLFMPAAEAATYTAATCNYTDVNSVINGPTHTVVSGDTISIPAGTCTWSSNLVGPIGVGFTLIGAGTPNSGAATTGASGSCSTTRIIDNAGSSNPLMRFTPGYGTTMRISCMAIDPNSTSTALVDPIVVSGACTPSGCPNVRVDNITFGLNTYWSESGQTSNGSAAILAVNVFGVLDHNSVGTAGNPAHNFEMFQSELGSYLGVGQYGDNSWAQPDSLGGANNLFAENNIKYDTGYLPMNDSEQDDGSYANRGGSRVVMRYNTMHQGSAGNGGYGFFADHGTDSGGRARGAREAEVYKNTIYCEAPSGLNCSNIDGGLRSGTGLFFGNTVTFSNPAAEGPWVSLVEYRNVTASWLPFAACGGDGPWDQNDGTIYYSGTVGSVSNGNLTMTDNSKSFGNLTPSGSPYSVYDVTQGWWSEIQSNTATSITVRPSVGYGPVNFVAGDSYQVLRAPLCIDQPGRGQGSYVSGTATNASVTSSGYQGPTFAGGPTPSGYPSQALDPIYRWNETNTNGNPGGGIVANGTSRFIAFRDFYDAASGVQVSPSAPFSCNGTTGGTGWGTLANRPSSCSGACAANSPGCGYFATDQSSQGTLYVWNSGAWTAYYTPYPYPHPLVTGAAQARSYTVKQDGTGDFTTIQACANAMAAGDTCTVFAGTYNENVTVPAGAVGNYKTMTVNGSDVVNVHSFVPNSYTKIIGFHIQNPSSPNGNACVSVAGGASYVYISSNVMSQCGGNTGSILYTDNGTGADHVFIQGNTLSYGCGTPAAPDACNGMDLFGNHFLVENNDLSHVLLAIDVASTYTVLRHNTFHDMNQSECTSRPGCHMDLIFAEPGATFPTAYNLWEGNTSRSISGTDSHAYLTQADVCGGLCRNVIIRWNDNAHLGSGGLIDDKLFPFVKSYNNTWVDFNNYPPNQLYGGTVGIYNNSTNGCEINDLFYYPEALINFNPYGSDATTVNTFSSGHNLGYCTASPCNLNGKVYGAGFFTDDPGNIIADPKFVSYAGNDFHLASGSPAIGTGSSLTNVAAGDSGSGTSLVVNDASYFQDGYGIAGVQGDWIRVGPTTTVQIVSVNYNTNTLTLAGPISRSAGDPVFLYKDSSGRQVLFGSAPDIGAYPFAGASSSICDVNHDNATNVVDVQQEVNQALGVAVCTSDINKDGACNVVDVQRVVNAALGGQCVSP